MAVPRLIWMVWLQGWDAAPPIVRACRATWENRNPGWEMRALTQDSLGDYRSVVPPRRPDMPRAAYSDLLRMNILSAFGGVWVDATAYCARPLDRWIDEAARSGFFAFRLLRDRMLSTWFLAACPDSLLLQVWAARASEYWRNRTAFGQYFWLHQLFAEAYRTDAEFRREWDAVPRLLARGGHLFVPQETRLGAPLEPEVRHRVLSGVDPVYKLTHRGPDSYPPGSAGDFLIRRADIGRTGGVAGTPAALP